MKFIQTINLSGAAALLLAIASAAPAQDRLISADVAAKEALPSHAGMSDDYYSLLQHLQASDSAGRKALAGRKGSDRYEPLFVTSGKNNDRLETYIWLESWDESLRDAVAKAGAEVIYTDPNRFLLQAWVPIDAAETISAIPGVRQLRRPSYGIPTIGSTTTEGDTNLQTNLIRTIGRANGLGFKVGVISSGLFNNIFRSSDVEDGSNSDVRVQSGDLPSDGPLDSSGPTFGALGGVQIFPASFTLHEPQDGNGNPTSEVPDGAAMLEIIHDLAPGASLFYGDGTTDLALENSRNYLEGKGVQVIVDNMVFFDSGRFDGTSAISRRARQITLTEDIVYVVSVGSYTPPPDQETGPNLVAGAKRFPLYVNGFFAPNPGAGTPKFHNFASGRVVQSRDEFIGIDPDQSVIDVVLVWDDVWDDQHPAAKDDLDLYLFNVVNGQTTGSAFASSTNLQNNSGLPIERMTAFTGPSGNYGLAIKRKNSNNSAPRLFTLLILQGSVVGTDVQYLTHGVPLNNADVLPPAISVGAIDTQVDINTTDPKTVPGISPGPGRALTKSFVKWFQGQQSPAVVSYANTHVLSAGSFGPTGKLVPGLFPGSSAATAHIGGLVTLLRHGFRYIPSFDFYRLLRDTSLSTFPNATQLNADALAQFENSPVYLRTNGYDTFANILSGDVSKSLDALSVDPVVSADVWTQSGQTAGFSLPTFGKGVQGLTLNANGATGVFGFWESPLFQIPTTDGGTKTTLRTDRVYELTARVGTDESDPTRVPDFRLRINSGRSDEGVTMDVAGPDNTPTTIGGREYKMYFRPSNATIASHGIRFSFDINSSNAADNAAATLFLQAVSLRELETQ
ncbi:hypothetical protein BH09SUM1_BH09SUM1_06200 [soil metagenome]